MDQSRMEEYKKHIMFCLVKGPLFRSTSQATAHSAMAITLDPSETRGDQAGNQVQVIHDSFTLRQCIFLVLWAEKGLMSINKELEMANSHVLTLSIQTEFFIMVETMRRDSCNMEVICLFILIKLLKIRNDIISSLS